MKKTITLGCSILLLVLSAASHAQTGTGDYEISSRALRVSLVNKGAVYQVKGQGLERPVFSARIGVEVDHQWLWSTDYPQSHVVSSEFRDQLGTGHKLDVAFTGLANQPDLKYAVELYDQLPFGDVQVSLQNQGTNDLQVQAMRVLDASGLPAST